MRDIVPPLPFYMRPSGVILYLRKKLGGAILLRTARSAWTKAINTQGIDKPTPADILQAVAQRRKGQRKQKESTLASLQLSSPPKQFRFHTSPMPISPSYRSKVLVMLKSHACHMTTVPPLYLLPPPLQVPKSKTSIVASSGIFVPPSSSTHIVPTSQQQTVSHISSLAGGQQQVSTSGIFIPPGE